MRIKFDAAKCQGYGNCVTVDDTRFDIDDDGIVIVLKEFVSPEEAETAAEAVRSCPVAAIWLDDDSA